MIDLPAARRSRAQDDRRRQTSAAGLAKLHRRATSGFSAGVGWFAAVEECRDRLAGILSRSQHSPQYRVRPACRGPRGHGLQHSAGPQYRRNTSDALYVPGSDPAMRCEPAGQSCLTYHIPASISAAARPGQGTRRSAGEAAAPAADSAKGPNRAARSGSESDGSGVAYGSRRGPGAERIASQVVTGCGWGLGGQGFDSPWGTRKVFTADALDDSG